MPHPWRWEIHGISHCFGRARMSDSNPPLPPYIPAPPVPPLGAAAPMTLGQILDRVFRLVRANLKPFIAIGFLPIAVFIALEAIIFGGFYLAGVFNRPPDQQHSMAILLTVLPMCMIFIPAMILIYGIYYGASTYAALEADRGVQVSALETIGLTWPKAGRYAWLLFLRGLIVALPIFACAFAVAIGALLLGLIPNNNASPAALFFLIPLGMLFYLGAIVYAVFMTLRYSLAFPACVHENITAFQAIKRSSILTNGAKGRIFLVLLIIYAINSVCGIILYAIGLFAFAIGAVAGMGHINPTSPLAISLYIIGGIVVLAVVFLWSAVLMSAYSTTFAVFYRDQCLRKDGAMVAPLQ